MKGERRRRKINKPILIAIKISDGKGESQRKRLKFLLEILQFSNTQPRSSQTPSGHCHLLCNSLI
jgi:hypothetical protein